MKVHRIFLLLSTVCYSANLLAYDFVLDRSVTEIRSLMKMAPSLLNATSSCYGGLAPIQRASREGRLDVVEMLLGLSAHVDVQTRQRSTSLHFAAANGHLLVAKALLSRGAMVDAQNIFLDTPSHLAARRGHENMVAILADWGASLILVNDIGQTPATAAWFGGFFGVGERIVDIQLHRLFNSGNSPQDTDHAVRLALSHLKKRGPILGSPELIKFWNSRIGNLWIRDERNRTIARFALDRNDTETVCAALLMATRELFYGTHFFKSAQEVRWVSDVLGLFTRLEVSG